MKKIQKCLLAILVLCLALSALAACTPAENSSADNATTTQEPTTEPTGTEQPVVNEYIFTVVYEDTMLPVEGVYVQLCYGDDCCLSPVVTDATGTAVVGLNGRDYGVYDVHILNDGMLYELPEGYSFDNTSVQTNETTKSYTLVLKKESCDHTFENGVCSQCGLTKFAVQVSYGAHVKDESKQGLPVEGALVYITKDNGATLVASGETDAEGNFVFAAENYVSDDGYSGYKIVIMDGVPDGYYVFEDDLLFMKGETEVLVECYTLIVTEEYTALYPLKIAIGSTVQLKMDKQRFDDGDEMFATTYDDSLYYFSVTPSKPSDVGHYKVTISNVPEGVTIYLGHYPSSIASVSFQPSASVTGEAGQTVVLEFNMEERYMKDSTGAWTYSNNKLFGIRVEGEASYPVEISITVERERDLIPGQDYTVTERETVEIVEGAQNMSEIIGDVSDKTLTIFDSENAADVTLVLGDDGFYRIGSADGAILLVNLKNSNAFFDGGEDSGVSFVNVNAVSGTENLLVSYWVEDHYEIKLYANMLQAYGELCGADGYYAVNEQLYTFLKDWTNQRVGDLFKGGLDEDHAFLLVCGYYA